MCHFQKLLLIYIMIYHKFINIIYKTIMKHKNIKKQDIYYLKKKKLKNIYPIPTLGIK